MLRSILQNSTAGFYVFASDSTAPTTGKTGLTLTVTLSKTGGTANAVSPTITEIGNGLYWIAPISAHRDTLGEIAWQFSASGAIIAPRLEKVVAVNDQVAAFGANTTAPDNSGILTAVNTRLAASSYTAPDNAGIAAIKVVTDRVNTGLVADGLVWQFTANMLELAPSSSGGLTTEQAETLDSIAIALAGSAPVEPTGRIAQGGTITAYIGDDFRVRSATQLEIPVADVGGALFTKLDTIGAANLNFSASRPSKGPGEITGTVADIVQDSATQLTLVVEIVNCGNGLMADDYAYQIEQQQTHTAEVDSFVEIEGTLTLKAKS